MQSRPPVDLAQEQRRILRNSAFALLVCVLILTAAHWGLPHLFRMPGDDLASLLTFWAGCALLTALWVVVGFAMVARGRRHSPDDIGGSAFAPPSSRIAIPVAFLQNTLEQAFMAVIVQIAICYWWALRCRRWSLARYSCSRLAGSRFSWAIRKERAAAPSVWR